MHLYGDDEDVRERGDLLVACCHIAAEIAYLVEGGEHGVGRDHRRCGHDALGQEARDHGGAHDTGTEKTNLDGEGGGWGGHGKKGGRLGDHRTALARLNCGGRHAEGCVTGEGGPRYDGLYIYVKGAQLPLLWAAGVPLWAVEPESCTLHPPSPVLRFVSSVS